MDSKEDIIKSLEPLFKKAEKNGSWFRAKSGLVDLLRSPKELRDDMSHNTCIWGPAAWELVDPKKELKELEHVAECARKDVERFKARMKA